MTEKILLEKFKAQLKNGIITLSQYEELSLKLKEDRRVPVLLVKKSNVIKQCPEFRSDVENNSIQFST